ncbi:hypothetical protein ASU31_09085 [Pedobacter ginsenosidimutans]|uniref:Uncharacterized protein n=1 Tax=Pedobacter ginsenosidimutans TaxID=687842 RepID=A0A0T5VR14_9SPHI|nr:hypothetical protein ASU31_09085 [Pedobacter ginsenosidimutans]
MRAGIRLMRVYKRLGGGYNTVVLPAQAGTLKRLLFLVPGSGLPRLTAAEEAPPFFLIKR